MPYFFTEKDLIIFYRPSTYKNKRLKITKLQNQKARTACLTEPLIKNLSFIDYPRLKQLRHAIAIFPFPLLTPGGNGECDCSIRSHNGPHSTVDFGNS